MQKYSPNIEPRVLGFSYQNISNIEGYYESDIHAYHFQAVALFLPSLEKMLVLSLRKALPLVENAQLRQEIASLVAQESIHGAEFNRYNHASLHNAEKTIVTDAYGMKCFRFIASMIHHISPTFHFALSAAGEHFTAISAELFLKDTRWFATVPPEYSALWRWHCIEELEHKAVAFDVYQSLNGRYTTRISAMLLMTVAFNWLYLVAIFKIAKHNKKLFDFSFYKRMLHFYWGKHGLMRSLLTAYCQYFKPRFHPETHIDSTIIRKWKDFLKTATKEESLQGLQSTLPPQANQESLI